MKHAPHRFVPCFSLCLLTALAVGCGSSTSSSIGSATASNAENEKAPAAPVTPPPLRETFETYYFQGSPIGTIRTVYQAEVLDGKPVVRIASSGTLTFLRSGQKADQLIRDVVYETEAGDVMRCESFYLAGPSPQTVTGIVTGDEMTLTLRTTGASETKKIAWPRGTRGPTAVVDSLRRKPLSPGETRTLTEFMPILNQVATVTLTARERETTDVAGTPRELLRIHVQSVLADKSPIDGVVWSDVQGEVWKQEIAGTGQVAIRTTKPVGAITPTVDLVAGTMVRITPPIADAHQSQLLRYKVRLADGDASTKFPNGASQTVKKLDDGAAEITVTAVRPTTPLPAGYTATPATDGDRRSSALVQSSDAGVQKLASAAGGNDADPWDVAVRCEKHVHDSMHSVNFSTAFATAAETAKSLSGDCTEHAVLLAALLRARGIPARAAIGLVYMEHAGAFGYHMWTEAWIGDRWIPLDATLGRGGISAAYLKITDTNLEGVDSFAAFLPVFPLLGRLQIEVLERK